MTIVAYDYPGELSILTGLLFVYGLDILSGEAFTYEPLEQPSEKGRRPAADTRRKIVDVFRVRPVRLGTGCIRGVAALQRGSGRRCCGCCAAGSAPKRRAI